MIVLGASVVDPVHQPPPSICEEMEVPMALGEINAAQMSNNFPLP